MSDELTIGGAIIVAAGGLGTVLKWAVGRLTKSWDTNGEETRKVITRNSDVMIDNTRSNAELAAKIDGVAMFVQIHTGQTPVQGVPITIAPVNKTSTLAPPTTSTPRPKPTAIPGSGYHLKHTRPSSRGDGK